MLAARRRSVNIWPYVSMDSWRRLPLWKKALGFGIILAFAALERVPALAPARPWVMLAVVLGLAGLVVLFFVRTRDEQVRRRRAAQQERFLAPTSDSAHRLVVGDPPVRPGQR